MSKRILIICDAIQAPLYAPRIRFLIDFLRNKNYTVTMVCEKSKPLPFERDYEIIEIPFYRYGGVLGKIEWYVKNLFSVLFDYKNKKYANDVATAVSEKQFDLVFCSTPQTLGLRAAEKIATAQKIPFLVDLRDIAEEFAVYEVGSKGAKFLKYIGNFYRNLTIRRRNRIIRRANKLISVSDWHVDFLRQINPNTELVYNGYDSEKFYPKAQVTEKFRVVYTGVLYSQNLRNPELLFQATANLLRQQKISETDFEIVFYSSEEDKIALQNNSKTYGLKDVLRCENFVKNEKIPTVLNQSSVVLVLTNKGTHGVMTTKFYEALGCERPVLCVRSDEGCLAETIAKTNAGIAAKTVEEVEYFLLEKYAEWKKNGFTTQNINQELKPIFTRQHQAKKMEEIFANS